jgi:hypothetical protein
LTDRELACIADGLDQLVKIHGIQELPPRPLFSPELNLPRDNL